MDFSKNYYETLGLNNLATKSEIRLSYRNLSKVWHPDISKMENAKEEFQHIVEAHETLSNEDLKEEYDVNSPWGKDWKEESQLLDFEFSNQGHEFTQFKEHSERTKNDRIHIIVMLEKFQSIINFDRLLLCNECNGVGKDFSKLNECLICKGDGVNSKGDKCFMCEGRGKIDNLECEMCNSAGTFMGQPCRLCKGKGSISLSECDKCEGDGRAIIKNTIEIREEDFKDNVLIIKGKGHASKLNIGIIGDLCIKIKP